MKNLILDDFCFTYYRVVSVIKELDEKIISYIEALAKYGDDYFDLITCKRRLEDIKVVKENMFRFI